MNSERAFKERVSEGLQALKEKVNLEDVRRAALNGKRYVKTHPVATVAMSLTVGVLLGYLAKAVVDRRRNHGMQGAS